jgi:hypothetical protein
MADNSNLDKKYFIDPHVYNCPFCNRRNVQYNLEMPLIFNWTEDKSCYVYFIKCSSCGNKSMHLSFESIHDSFSGRLRFSKDIDIDSKLFYSVPTSFFVLDNRIPKVLRELITEADGCLKMNFLTGASACMRKAIYELLIHEKCTKLNYDERIKELKTKFKETDPALFDILGHIQGMTSDKIHEQSWDQWDSKNLTLLIETLKEILHNIYVIPAIKAERLKDILKLKENVVGQKGQKKPPSSTDV